MDFGLDKCKQNAIQLGTEIRQLLEGKGYESVAADGCKAPTVVVSYSASNLVGAFLSEGIKVAGPVPFKIDEPEGFVKILADATTDAVIGCHIIGPQAGDLIQEIVVAMELSASSEDIARICHGHPGLSEAIKESALNVSSRAIHI